MTYIVAELGINHGGNIRLAKKMIKAAKDCGCDAVKLQSYRVDDFLGWNHPDYLMFEQAEIWEDIPYLREFSRRANIEFGATPTSVAGVAELVELEVDFLKNGADFLLRHDVLRAMADSGLPTFVSVGMATRQEMSDALWSFDKGKVVVLQCTSAYPCPDSEVNLSRITEIRRSHRVGFSDHTQGITAAIAAVALGAEVVEFHFTLDKNADGPDHWFSKDVEETSRLVTEVRRVEKMMGSSVIMPTESELKNRDKWRIREGMTRSA